MTTTELDISVDTKRKNGSPASDAMSFEGFVVQPSERQLIVDNKIVKISARALDLLFILIAERDRVVTKDELLERVWPGLVVEENNLSVHVSQLRKYCGRNAISTIPGRGYQFTATRLDLVKQQGVYRLINFQSSSVRRGNVPAQLPKLIGRDAEVDELYQLLVEQRWVTVTGAGGIGKTRIAEVVGQKISVTMPTWIVELASVSDPRFVASAIAQVLGITIIDSERPLDAIVFALQEQEILLILDNCEHLIPTVSDLCNSLLRDLPLLSILVTSQEHLRGEVEVIYKLNPLALPDGLNIHHAKDAGSLRLLEERIQALSRNFTITRENLNDAISICRQLDGLPLAIELAAGRVPMLGLSGVREGLGELFRLLTGGSRVRLRRHQTLRAALDWSYQLLAPQEQALLRRLGVFAGGFSIEGVRLIAEDLDEDEWDVLDTLGSLIDKSLVHVQGLEHPRYLMLETTRAYALEQLALLEETSDALSRHAHATQLVCTAAKKRRDTQAIWNEIANIRAAFSWSMENGEIELAVGLANDSSVVLGLGGLVGEVVQRLVEVEPCVNDKLPRPLAAQYWQWLGRFGNDGRLPAQRCVAALQTAEALYRELSNHRHVHACLRMRAEALVEQGELDAASEAIECARKLENQNGPMADSMRRLRIEAKILEGRSQFDEAIKKFREALDVAYIADIHRYIATLTQDIGQCQLNANKAIDAEKTFRELLGDPRNDLSIALWHAYGRMGLAIALLSQGSLTEAREVAINSISSLRSCGILLSHSEVFALLLASLEKFTHAKMLLATADSFREFSNIARNPTQKRAYEQTRKILANHATANDLPCSAIDSEAELSKMIADALIS